MDRDYLGVCRNLRRNRDTPVLVGFDDKWTGTIRQRIGALVFPILFRPCFSHAWVAGPYQYHFARMLGFKDREILFDLLTANTKKFIRTTDDQKAENRHNFLYVGNFREVKGTRLLIDAYRIYRTDLGGTWGMVCVGNGPLLDLLRQNSEIDVHGYASEDELKEIAGGCSVFVLPSIDDKWGVALHEFASLGMPLLVSENVGASPVFLIDGFNGFLFRENSAHQLASKMLAFEMLDEHEIRDMEFRSMQLASRISVESCAANFVAPLFEKRRLDNK